MSSFEDFRQQVRGALEALTPSDEVVEALRSALGIGDGEGMGFEAVIEQALSADQLPVLLHAVLASAPTPEAAALLERWEDDANLQDHWTDRASARDLQAAKAHYVLALRELKEEDARTQQVTRLHSKLSRALLAHPDNVHGQFDIYGTVRATRWLKSGKVSVAIQGEDLITGEDVVIMVVKPEFSSNTMLVNAFVEGTRAQHLLRHPQIARVLAPANPPEQRHDRVFAVLEWAGNDPLTAHISDDALSLSQRCRLAIEACQGLHHAHQKGCLHGDFSPDCVLIAPSGGVRLIGFLQVDPALPPGSWTSVAMMIGNPYYIAPEISGGQPPSVASDIFALGRVLFRLLSGVEENLYQVMVPQMFKQSLEEHLSAHPELIDILERATHMDPSARPERVHALLEGVHRVLGQLGSAGDPALDGPRAEGDWGTLAEALSVRAEGLAEDDPARFESLSELAELAEYVMDLPLAALGAWAQTASASYVAYRQAEGNLARLLDDIGENADAARFVADAVAGLLEGHADEVPEDEALRLSLKAAELYHQRVGDQARAIDFYLAVIEREPSHAGAIEALDALYQARGDAGGLIALLERCLEVARDERERVSLLLRMARLQEGLEGEGDAAVATYQRALEQAPGHREAFEELDALLRRLARWDDVAALLAAESQRRAGEGDVEGDRAARFALAQVQETHRGEPLTAIGLYRGLLDEVPAHAPTLEALARLAHAEDQDEGVRAESATLLEPIYRRDLESGTPGGAVRLARLLEVRLRSHAAGEDAWVNVLAEVARLYEATGSEEDAEGFNEAFDALARLHRGRPHLEAAWDALARLAPRCAPPRWTDVVSLHRAVIEDAEGAEHAELVATLWLRVGAIQARELEDPEAAIEAYREALAVAPDDREALQQLETLYTQTEQWRALIGILDRVIRLQIEVEEVDAARGMLHRVAEIWEVQLGDVPASIQALTRALGLEGEDAHALGALERLAEDPEWLPTLAATLRRFYSKNERWASLCALLEQQLAHDPAFADPATRANTFAKLAQITSTELDDAPRALDYRLAAVAADISREDLRRGLEGAAERIGEWSKAADFYAAQLVEREDLEESLRLRLLLTLGGWYSGPLEAREEAVRCYRRVLELDGEHGGALNALDALYVDLGEHEALHEVLTRKAAIAERPEDEIKLQFRVATLADAELGRVDVAVEAYRRIVALDPRECEALSRLAEVFEREGDIEALVETLGQRVEAEDDAEKKVVILTRIGRLYEGELHRSEDALRAYEQALALDPSEPRELLEATLDLHRASGDLDSFFTLLPRCLEHAQTDAARVALHSEAAEIASRSTDGTRSAVPHFEAILAIEPYHIEALVALETHYETVGAWVELDDIFRRQFTRLHLRAARLARSGLSDLARALDHLTSARALDPMHREVLDQLCEIYELTGDTERLSEVVEQRLDLMDDQPLEKARLLRGRAAELEASGESPEKELDLLARSLVLSPEHPEALLRFALLALRQGRWEDLIGPIVGAMRSAQDAVVIGLRAALEHAARAALALVEGREEEAFASFEHVVDVEGIDLEFLLDLLKVVFSHFGQGEALGRHLEAEIDQTQNETWRHVLLTRSAEIAEETGDDERAFSVYSQLFEQDPTRARARENMLRVARTLGRTEQALERIAARLDSGLDDDALFIDLTLMLARHYDEPGHEAQAVHHYQQAIARDPRHSEALNALIRLHEAGESWAPLAEVLRLSIPTLDADDQQATQLRLARLRVERFDDADGAVALCEEMLASEGGLTEARREAVIALLEAQERTLAADGGALYQRVAEALRAEYARAGRPEEELRLLTTQLGHLDADADASARISLLSEIASTALENDLRPRAFDAWLSWFALEPENEELRDELEQLAEELDAWARLVEAFDAAAQRSDADPALAWSLASAAAARRRDALQDPEAAAETFAFALTLEGGDDAERSAVIEALEALYLELGQIAPLIELLRRKAALCEGADEKRGLLLRATQLAEEELNDAEEAARCYEALLEEFGTDVEILTRLERLHASSNNVPGQLAALERLRALAEENDDVEALPGLLLRAARLHRQAGANEEATAAFEALLGHEPEHLEALATLAQLHEDARRWPELLEILIQHADALDDAGEEFAQLMRAVKVAERVKDRDRAIELCLRADTLNPGDAAVTGVLYKLLEGARRWAELADLWQQEFDRLDDAEAQVELGLKIAEIALDTRKLDDVERAEVALRLVLERSPGHREALIRLLEIYERQAQWPYVEALLEQLMVSSEGAGEKVDILLRRGDIQREHLGELESAITTYQTAHEIDPSRPEPRERLVLLYTEAGAWDHVMTIYEQDIEHAANADEQVALELKLAALVRERSGDHQRVLGILQRAYGRQPSFPTSLEVIIELIECFIALELLSPIISWLETGFEIAQDQSNADELVATLWYYMGLISADDPEAAFNAHEECFRLNSRHVANNLMLGELLLVREDYPQSLKVLQMARLRATQLSPEQNLALYYLMGMVRVGMGEPRRAKDMFRRALQIDKEHAPSKEMMETL